MEKSPTETQNFADNSNNQKLYISTVTDGIITMLMVVLSEVCLLGNI